MAHIAIDARIINSTTGRYVERLVTHLQDIDHVNNYSVLVRKEDKDYWKPSAKNFKVVVADFKQYSLSEQIGFNRFLKRLAPDLVHFGIIQQPILYPGKKVTTVHDMTLLKTYNSDKNWFTYHFKQFIGSFVFKSVAKTNDHLIAISKFTKKEFVAYTHIPKEKVTVIYEASDVQAGGVSKYALPFGRYIMYVGAQSDYKNIKRLGEAHQKLLKSFPDLGLVLVGKKSAAHLANQAYFQKMGYKNILFTDFVPDNQLNWLYKHATAYVFPSLMEGFGLPGLEAMGHGTPVVSSNATCLPEIYGSAAHYFDPNDVDDMTRAIHDVLADDKLRVKLSTRGYEQIKKYSWEKMARESYGVYLRAGAE